MVEESLSAPTMTTANFRIALVFSCLFWASHAFSADDSIFKEAQDATLKTLDLPLGVSGKQTLHIRLKSKGANVTYELWNAKLHMRLSEAAELSVADKLNGLEQALWQGEAVLTAGAYRMLTNPDSIGQGELKYQHWKETLPPLAKMLFWASRCSKPPKDGRSTRPNVERQAAASRPMTR
ncbi:hypothetical protein [Verrucomicrobium spinosum]|uniref:hypothetical protein n=1 Tax=Verrucomicrobium spinosum TaxID=2736 RepID=UPI001C47167E|nr:hypothetical protein [Verrucomicrobium spinosum]